MMTTLAKMVGTFKKSNISWTESFTKYIIFCNTLSNEIVGNEWLQRYSTCQEQINLLDYHFLSQFIHIYYRE